MGAQNIILGNGVFAIGGTPVAITRGGGQFVVEREIRHIDADGDRGEVKGRHVIDKSIPKLTMNSLEIVPTNLKKMYPGLTLTTEAGKTLITGSGKIVETDYVTEVTWTGKTKAGKAVIITVKDAINLENFDWSLADKDEVVASLTYTGCYEEDSPEGYEPWEIEYAE